MTEKQFKEKYPEYANLEGNELWDTMTSVMLLNTSINPKDEEIIEYIDNKNQKWLIHKSVADFFEPPAQSIELESYQFVIMDMSDCRPTNNKHE